MDDPSTERKRPALNILFLFKKGLTLKNVDMDTIVDKNLRLLDSVHYERSPEDYVFEEVKGEQERCLRFNILEVPTGARYYAHTIRANTKKIIVDLTYYADPR